MKEHDGYNPTEMPRRESEHESAGGRSAAMGAVDTSPRMGVAVHARRGEHVSVWVDVIKADKRDEWERLLHDVIAPAALKVDPDVLRCTRLLEPVTANEDGTWTFVIMPDPLDERCDYDAGRYVREAFGKDKGDEADRVWEECHSQAQYEIALIQSSW